jgi:class 3 adenylate cyclase/Cdc6-like AAA superfamily ATPase
MVFPSSSLPPPLSAFSSHRSSLFLVIAFAGDSLLCLFLPSSTSASSSSPSSECCLRAIQCGYFISKCHIQETTTHIGITYGKLCIALLGTYLTQSSQNNCSIVMNGTCLDEIAVCLDHAKSEEVVISHDLYSQIQTDTSNPFKTISLGMCCHDKVRIECHLLIAASPSSVALLRHDPSTDYQAATSTTNPDPLSFQSPRLTANLFDLLSGLIPSPVAQAASTQSFNHLSEIRTVTTLFLKLESYSTQRFSSLSSTTCGMGASSLKRFYESMINCLEDCGGMLRQFLIDDKGCVLIGLWGVPTANHPNNCCMAMRCSVLMKIKAKELNEIVSIGVTTGSVYCGIVGSTKRADYVAIGHSVNLSARLMCKANGSIYLDQTTQQKLPLVLMNHIVPVKGLKLKGINTCPPNTSPDKKSGAMKNTEGTACYYKYDSLILPSERLRDVHEEQMVIIDHYIKRKRIEIFQVIGFCESDAATNGSFPHLLFHESSSRSHLQSPTLHHASSSVGIITHPRVLIVQGGSGSGKTATMNYFLRKIHEDAVSESGRLNLRLMTPLNDTSFISKELNTRKRISAIANTRLNPIVYVSLLASGDNSPYYALRCVIETALDRLNCSVESYHQQIKTCLFKAFPDLVFSMNSSHTSATLFSILQEALHLHITLDEFLQISISSNSSITDVTSCCPEDDELLDNTFRLTDRTVLLSSLLSAIIQRKEVQILVVEDAHFMCKASWDIFSYFCQGENLGRCLLMMTMRKDSQSHVATPAHGIKNSPTPRAKTVASLSYASSIMTTHSASQKITHISSAQNTRYIHLFIYISSFSVSYHSLSHSLSLISISHSLSLSLSLSP